MDFFGMIKAAADQAHVGGLLISLPPNRWDKVSINGKKTATVTAHGIGFENGAAWTYFTFRDDADGAVTTLWGEEDSHSHAAISLADGARNDDNHGAAQDNPRIAVHPLIVFPEIKVSIHFKFGAGKDQPEDYRFDGRSWP